MAGERVAYGGVAVDRRHHQNIRRAVHGHHLEVLHKSTQKVVAIETVGDIPDELRQHVKDGDENVRQTEVDDKPLHPGHFLLPGPQDDEDEDVAEEREVQDH